MQLFTKNFILFCFISLYLLAVFPLVASAQQGTCQHTIKTMEAQPTVVTPDSRITFHATVEQTGTGPACTPFANVDVAFYAQIKPSVAFGSKSEMARVSVSFQGTTTKQIQKSYDLKSFTLFNQLADPNKLPYFMEVQTRTPGGYKSLADTKSWGKYLTISGNTPDGSQGLLNARVTFDKAIASPTSGDLTVFVNMNDTDIAKLTPKVAMLTYMNGKHVGNNYGANNSGINRTNLKNNQTFQTVEVSVSNGFRNGSNTVRVDIQDATAPFKLYARGTGTVQAQGLGDQPPQPRDPDKDAPKPDKDKEGAGPSDASLKEVLFNPLPVDSLTGVLLYITRGFLAIVALWGVTFIIIGGFKLVMAQGQEEAYLAAKKTITWAILGVVVAMLSFSIIAIVQNLIGAQVPEPPPEENPIVRNPPK